MARRGRSSIVREVKESIDLLDKIGQSKRSAKSTNTHGIHSKKQKENTLSDCQNFVKWCRSEFGVKSIADLTPKHYNAYIDDMRQRGLSEGHRINVETSLRILENGFRARCERFESGSDRFVGFCPEKRIESRTRGLDVRNRSYSEREVQLIREYSSEEVQKAIDLMYHVGMRVRESANVLVEHFEKENGQYVAFKIKEGDGAGITKGGRHRTVPIPQHFQGRLKEIIGDKQGHERVVNVSPSTIRNGVNKACKSAGVRQNSRGCHGFRHAYARERMQQLMDREQQAMMYRVLENCKAGRKADYGILSDADKSLWKSTKELMDVIHGELGHGENRWELGMRYLGE